MSLYFVRPNPFCTHSLMGSYMSSTYPEYLSSNSGSMAPSSQQSDPFSGNLSSQHNEDSELETPTPAAPVWEPRKIRAKVGGSYWVVENDKKCVIFCKMQMAVYTSLSLKLIEGWRWSGLRMGVRNKQAFKSLGWIHWSPSTLDIHKNKSNTPCTLQPLSHCSLSS